MSFQSNRLPNVDVIASVILGLITAICLGLFLGSDTYRPVLLAIIGIIGVIITLAMKDKIWLLIPIMSGVTGTVAAINIPIPLSDVAKIYVFGLFLIFYALKIHVHSMKITKLDMLLGVNLLYLFSVFLRNPAGLNMLGSELVGGKPYFIVFASTLAWVVLSKVRLSPRLGPWFPILNNGPGIALAGLSLLGWYFPGSVPFLHYFYSGVATQTYMAMEMGTEATKRVMPFVNVGLPLVALLIAYYRPLSLVNPFKPVRMFLFAFGMYAILMSGFRSFFLQACVYYLLASVLRTGFRDLPKVAMAGTLSLMVLVMIQSATGNLPFGIQRALSFVPVVEWSPAAKRDAQGSSDWRRQMWREVWTEEGWIRNKWLGDGFGFTRRDLELNLEAQFGVVKRYNADLTLSQKINADYHNGPLSAIKFVGGVGLVLFTLLILYRGVYAWRLWQDAKGTPYAVPVLLATLPGIYYPFAFFFVFGAYNAHFPGIILSIGLLNLYRNSLDDYLREQKKKGAIPQEEPMGNGPRPVRPAPLHAGKPPLALAGRRG